MSTTSELLHAAARHQQAGEPAKAEALYRQVLKATPTNPDAHHLLGVLYCQQGRSDVGIAHMQKAIELNPGVSVFHFNLGIAFKERDQLDQAIAAYRQALALDPANSTIRNNLGVALKDKGAFAEAAELFRQAVQAHPDNADAHNNYGVALKNLGRFDEALAEYRQALRLDPNSAQAQGNIGNVLHAQGKPAAAEEYFRAALHLKSDDFEMYNNLANALKDQGKLKEALEQFEQALRQNPGNKIILWNRSILRLSQGDFAGGWLDFEQRWAQPGAARRSFPRPRWDGSPLKGKTIFLYAEQGLGDTLQFVRYARLVKEQGATVLFGCQPALERMLGKVAGIDQLITSGSRLPPYDFEAPLMSLPSLFKTDLASIPADVPYLDAEPELALHWRRELAAVNGFKVGIAWQGNPKNKGDALRSLPLASFEPLAKIPGVKLVSLQLGAGAEQLATLGGRFDVLDWTDRLDKAGAFLDTAAVIKNLDLVISVDSAIAHLAGALAAPAWTLLALVPDWRWLLEREDSPWYPSMRLFRQKTPGAWGEVLGRVATELSKLANNRPER